MFVFELTGDYAIVLPLMLATVAADLVARWLLDETLMTEKLTRRGRAGAQPLRARRVPHDDRRRRHAAGAPTGRRPAGSAAPAGALRPDAPLADALPLLADHAVDDVPVVDGDGRLVGVCTRHDLLSARMALLELETPQPGWLARRRFRPADDLARGPAS